MKKIHMLFALLLITGCSQTRPLAANSGSTSQNPGPITRYQPMTLDEALTPYTGPIVRNVSHSTLSGTVMCGYQGWFTHRDDRLGMNITHHWGDILKTPPRCSVDFWPDMSELTPSEKFPTNYKHADGSQAYVFSSVVKPTVLRHFKWMQDYGINGVFVQRFCSQLFDPARLRRVNVVLNHCREGANRYGRSFSVMYDTSFDKKSCKVMTKDWSELLNKMQLTKTPAYQYHKGRPVLALWGYGFRGRSFDESSCEEFLRFLKSKKGGNCLLLAGVPNNWLSWQNGTPTEKAQFRLLNQYFDIIQPWNVGRYGSPEKAAEHYRKYWPNDIAWCKKYDKDYYAVIFPGFSWTNHRKGQAPLNQIPRMGGRFLWTQAELVKKYGMNMAYIAMFDEVDEGTAIFKCTNNPPQGRFATYEGLPSDHYLKLAGMIEQMLQGKQVKFPNIKPDKKKMSYKPMSPIEYYQGDAPLTDKDASYLKKNFANTPIALIGANNNSSTWVYSLYPVLQPFALGWNKVLNHKIFNPENLPIVIFGKGSEQLLDDKNYLETVPKIIDQLRNYVQNGGTLIVAAGGRHPMYYPSRSSDDLLKIGLRLEDSKMKLLTIKPNGKLNNEINPWNTKVRWLPSQKYYDRTTAYLPIFSVFDQKGNHVGDTAALIGPGGDLGKGRILYIDTSLQKHPQRSAVITSVLKQLAIKIH